MRFINLVDDVYYDDEYLKLYVESEKEIFSFEYKENKNIFINKSIKKPIEKIGELDIEDGYFDLESAYGYGGFLTNCDDISFIERAMKEYEDKCRNEKIIAEFIRFHPFNSFPEVHAGLLDFVAHDRDVVVFDLGQEILPSYKTKVRSIIKKSLQCVEILESNNLAEFIDLYEKTMRKNKASGFYYFNKNLYRKLFELKQAKLYEARHDGKIVAMAFFMFGADIAHYHLSANSDESYLLNTNYALLHSLFEVAKNNDKKYFLLGGGTTSNDDDPLYRFKKKFSKNTKAFYISGKIYNKPVYDRYCELWSDQATNDMKYFLKYRLEVS